MSWWHRIFGTSGSDSPAPQPSRREPCAGMEEQEATGQIPTLPDPPAGYTWERAALAGAYLLRPQGWYFMSSEPGPMLSYFITKQPMPPDDEDNLRVMRDMAIQSMEQGQFPIRHGGPTQFETGVAIAVWPYVSRVKGMSPSGYAQAYVEHRSQRSDLVLEGTWAPRLDPFFCLGVQFRFKADPLRQCILLVANDATDIVYHVGFESPLRLWDQDWPIAKVVLERLAFHPER